jgi:hypothetical protein
MKIRAEVKINCELEHVSEFMLNGENLKIWNSAVKDSKFKSESNEETKLYSIVRKLPNQIVENTLEIRANNSVNTIDMKTISGAIPFKYHYKLVPFRGTTAVILNAEIDRHEFSSLLGRKMKRIPQVLLKKMILKEVNRNLYSLKIDLEKKINPEQFESVV